jgi:hypothetical protein
LRGYFLASNYLQPRSPHSLEGLIKLLVAIIPRWTPVCIKSSNPTIVDTLFNPQSWQWYLQIAYIFFISATDELAYIVEVDMVLMTEKQLACQTDSTPC